MRYGHFTVPSTAFSVFSGILYGGTWEMALRLRIKLYGEAGRAQNSCGVVFYKLRLTGAST